MRVLVTDKSRSDSFPLEIESIECVFNEKSAGKGHTYHRNDDYTHSEHMIVNLAGGTSTPLFKYHYEFKGEGEKLYQIELEPTELAAKKSTKLIATEWHPIMKTKTILTVASLLSPGDSILLNTGQGRVKTVKKVNKTEVLGLALGKVPAGEGREVALGNIQRALNNGEAYWNDFGLNLEENIMFVEGIASGTLALQYQFREKLSKGIELSSLEE